MKNLFLKSYPKNFVSINPVSEILTSSNS